MYVCVRGYSGYAYDIRINASLIGSEVHRTTLVSL